MSDSAKSSTPITVIGGYLGAGKTTLVNHLLRNANGQKLAILVNEFGELPIDADLIEAEEDNLISLAGGCICCSYGNDMVAALMALSEMNPPPDHVVVEASGVAIPSAIAGSVSLLSDYSMDGIVVLVDAMSVLEHANDTYLSDTIHRQIVDSDLILINKSDLVDKKRLVNINAWLNSQTPDTQVIASIDAKVPNEVVLNCYHEAFSSQSSGKFSHLTGFRTKTLVPDGLVDAHAFGSSLISENPSLVRAKGFVRNRSGEMKTIQIVGKRLDVLDAAVDARVGIVLILQDYVTPL